MSCKEKARISFPKDLQNGNLKTTLCLAMAEDRKTPEMRAQMTEIERLRHSAAHVLATAIICHPERSEGSLNPAINHKQ